MAQIKFTVGKLRARHIRNHPHRDWWTKQGIVVTEQKGWFSSTFIVYGPLPLLGMFHFAVTS